MPDQPSTDDQLPLDVKPPELGYVGKAVQASVEAAALDSRDKGAGALAVACARAVDTAQRRGDPYAVAAAARELRETLIRLRLDPVARLGNDAGQLQTWLAGLQAPTHDSS